MLASQESASNKKRVLFVTPNWLGDCIMAMAAIEVWHRSNSEKDIVIATRPNLFELLQMHNIKKQILLCEKSLLSIIKNAKVLHKSNINTAFIFPNSPRSALLPFLARIPERYGFAGYWRRFMLSNIVKRDIAHQHQIMEYLSLLNCKVEKILPPTLVVPEEAQKKVKELIQPSEKFIITFIPGAARGKSKQWPLKNFITLGRKLLSTFDCLITIAGTQAETEICGQLTSGLENKAINLAGKTSLFEFAALLASSKVVVANDSGGMHLAAALGTATVAIFGITDPLVTGPVGEKVKVLKASKLASRDIARNSKEATHALEQITPDMVFDAIKEFV